jgi:hypothetical protein
MAMMARAVSSQRKGHETTELLSRDDFRAALEHAIKGREAKNASFSQAWAEGKLQRNHFARWGENHYHYVGRSRITWGLSTPTLPTPRDRRSGYFSPYVVVWRGSRDAAMVLVNWASVPGGASLCRLGLPWREGAVGGVPGGRFSWPIARSRVRLPGEAGCPVWDPPAGKNKPAGSGECAQ